MIKIVKTSTSGFIFAGPYSLTRGLMRSTLMAKEHNERRFATLCILQSEIC